VVGRNRDLSPPTCINCISRSHSPHAHQRFRHASHVVGRNRDLSPREVRLCSQNTGRSSRGTSHAHNARYSPCCSFALPYLTLPSPSVVHFRLRLFHHLTSLTQVMTRHTYGEKPQTVRVSRPPISSSQTASQVLLKPRSPSITQPSFARASCVASLYACRSTLE